MNKHDGNKFDYAHLINKFYERFPLDLFKDDNERSYLLGVFLAGAEIKRLGEYILWEIEEQEDDY